MLQKKRTKCVFLFSGIVTIMLFLMVLFFPIRLSVKLPDVVYAGQVLTTDQVQITARSLLGLSLHLPGSSFVATEGNATVICQSGWLKKTCNIDAVQIDSYAGVYEGSVYAGQVPQKDKVQVSARYEDGTHAMLDVLSVTNVPIANRSGPVSFQVVTQAGPVQITDVPVIRPEKLQAVYDDEVHLGDLFLSSQVKVLLHYVDGTSYRTSEFLIHDRADIAYEDVKSQPELLHVPAYLDGSVKLCVLTPYGTTDLVIEPGQGEVVYASYQTDVIHEGDKLQEDQLLIQQGEHTITEFTFSNPGPVMMDCTVRIPTRYGLAEMPVDVIPVTSVSMDNQNCEEGDAVQVSSVTLHYEDGWERKLAAEDVQFLNLPSYWSDSQMVWFTWQGKEYGVLVEPLSQQVKDARGSYHGPVYQLSEETIQKLTLLCQRLCNDNIAENQAELSLLLNRYELYGSGQLNDEIWDYVLQDGYWGDAESIESTIQYSTPHPEVQMVLKDMLRYGYRTLPLYVDERLSNLPSDGLLMHSVLPDGFRFYQQTGSFAYGYTEDAYQVVEGKKPPDVASDQIDGTQPDSESGIVIEHMG